MKHLASAWARRQAVADRLGCGSSILARRLAARAAGWVRAGRRSDLTGWRAALGAWLRLVVLAAAGWTVWSIVRSAPALLWLVSGLWVWRAWLAAAPPEAPAEEVPEQPAETAGGPTRALLLDLVGDGPGVHLRTVLAHLQSEGHAASWTVTDLRARVEALGIPVQKVRERGSRTPTIGVRRADLEAPTAAPSPAEPEQAAEPPATAA